LREIIKDKYEGKSENPQPMANGDVKTVGDLMNEYGTRKFPMIIEIASLIIRLTKTNYDLKIISIKYDK
jgi:hypothetical protein